MLVLKLLRFFLPEYHPFKYWWINYYFGKQSKKAWSSDFGFVYLSKIIKTL